MGDGILEEVDILFKDVDIFLEWFFILEYLRKLKLWGKMMVIVDFVGMI